MLIVVCLVVGIGLAIWISFAVTVMHMLDYRWAGIDGIEMGWTELIIHRDMGVYQGAMLMISTEPVWLGSLFIASGCALGHFMHR